MSFELYEYKIEDLGKVITGKTPPSKISDAFSAQGIPFVTPKDMDGRRLIDKTERYLSSQGIEAVRNCLLPQNSIAVSCIGSDMGKAVLLPGESITNQQINSIIVDSKRFDYKYVYYYLSTLQDELKAIAGGSATPILNKGHFSQFKVSLPIRTVQNKISLILDSLDAKIEVNTEINQTLEQMAQALFKSWFVDFEPVKAKMTVLEAGGSQEDAMLAAMTAISGKDADALAVFEREHPEHYAELKATAELFPSAMQESELGAIPEGWTTPAIQDVASTVKGKSYKSTELDSSKTALVTLKSFNRGGGYRLDGLKEYTGKYKSDQEVFAGDLIIAYTDVTQAADVIGKPAMVISDTRYKHLVISLDVAVVRPLNDNLKYYLYGVARTEQFQNHTKSHSTGTTVLHLSKNAVPSYKFILANEKWIDIYAKHAKSIFSKINITIEESNFLSELRDTLLPKLLSGEITLQDAEQAVSEAENV
ncbi:restriction endonuclease subunit S [Pantoea dispersa]|uniref:restriction endonuclease subunit S n=1 Tax=Pantoea dispersa TaxID=59814 RepID=UPI003B80D16F